MDLEWRSPRAPDPRDRELGQLRRMVVLLWACTMALAVMWVWDRFAHPPGAGDVVPPPPPATDAPAAPRPVDPAPPLPDGEQRAVELFRRASRSVVFITTQRRELNPWTLTERSVAEGTGSGFLWDAAGRVITNYHVIRGASAAEVVLSNHRRFAASLVGVSPDHDLAVLAIDPAGEELQPLPMGASKDLAVGQAVYAIGNPFGLDQTLTTGIVSALGRRIDGPGDRPIEDVIQTDAAINPGNSGGPLLDSAGRLIGVNTSIYSPSGASAGIGFAIPVDTVNRVVPGLIARGRYAPPDLGVKTDDRIGRILLRRQGVAGVLVLEVAEGSPAARAGLKPTRRRGDGAVIVGDVILAIDGASVTSSAELASALETKTAGQTVALRVWRAGNVLEIEVVLGS